MSSRTPATRIMRRAQNIYSDSREVARNGASHAKTFIHQRPVLSTLMGLGLGLLIGHLIRPKE